MISSSGNPLRGTIVAGAMIDLVRSGKVPASLAIASSRIGEDQLRLVCIALLSWLGSRSRIPKMTRMNANEAGSAKDALIALVGDVSPFNDLFCISEGVVEVKPELSNQELAALLTLVADRYNPPKFVTRKPPS
jgi:hypothetical protein